MIRLPLSVYILVRLLESIVLDMRFLMPLTAGSINIVRGRLALTDALYVNPRLTYRNLIGNTGTVADPGAATRGRSKDGTDDK